ncbi:unnamed protein product [Adineta steineri]|uniref:Centrosomal protein of 19 kDa n=1 Tax=Adineta steineri TaxID=433720 RepID=A0A813VYF4_9BILA|nr:unnamed protein product [Adineta steineri]CAF3681683.1 unnamed protein product [Adineta steineri]
MSSSTSIKMQKMGVRFKPPTIFLFYTDTSTGKFRRRTVPLTDFTKNTNITDYTTELHNDKTTKNRNLFRHIPVRRLERLLFVLKEGITTNISKSDIEKKLRTFDNLDPNEDLNKLDDDALKHKKLIMSESYEKNRVDPSSKDFVYDVAVDFEQPAGEKQTSEWDSSEEVEEDIPQQKDDEDDDDDDDEDEDDFK